MRRRGCEVCRKSVVRGVMSKSFVGLLCPVDRKTERPAPMTTRSKYLEQVGRAKLKRSALGFAGKKDDRRFPEGSSSTWRGACLLVRLGAC